MPEASVQTVILFTDGSCHTQYRIGGWAAIILMAGEKTVLSGKDGDTTHQRMELTAVIRALAYLSGIPLTGASVQVFTDSQYVAGLAARREKLAGNHFKTKESRDVANADLVQELFRLTDRLHPVFINVKAHQKKEAPDYNREADLLCRSIVREAVAALT